MFDNLKVLELASVLAGPSVGQFFAELGAEVIKVENALLGGDITRTWKLAGENTDDRSAYFCSVNWGKKSVALDLTTDRGKNLVQKLVSKSDIVITSYKPGDAEKLGVEYEQLNKNNPRLIYGQITGYGADDDRVGYDAVLQAESGFMDLNGEKDGSPTKMPVALIDVLAGHQLKEGLLLALLNREKTGKGNRVEVSLIETAISSLTNQASNYLVGGKIPTRQGSRHPNIAPYGESFETADGKWIILAIGSNRQFKDLCEIVDINLTNRYGKFSDNVNRVEDRIELAALLERKFKVRNSDELMAKIHSKKIPAGIIQTVEQALTPARINSILLSHNNLKGLRNFVGHFTHHNQNQPTSILPPPHFGEHTESIISDLS